MNSLKKGEGVPLLNFVGGPKTPLLNFEGDPGVPLLNFEAGPGSRVPGSRGPGPTFTPCQENTSFPSFKKKTESETYLKPCQISEMEHFTKTVNGFWVLTIFAKHFILNVCLEFWIPLCL